MIDDFRNHLDAVGDQFFGGAEVMTRLHTAQQEILRLIVQEDPSFFISTADLTLVAGTSLYDLPLNARLGSRIVFTEDTADATEVPATGLKSYFSLDGPGLTSLIPGVRFLIQGQQVRILPTPAAAGTYRVWYVPTYGNMLEGYPSAVTSTTLSFFTSTPNYSTNYGKVNRRNDYYNGMSVEIIAGTGVGQTRPILDYDGSTRKITVATWDTTPTTSSTFAIICPVPEDHHSLVPLRAAMIGAIKNRNRMKDLKDIYFGVPGQVGSLFELLSWIANRLPSQGRLVQPFDNGY